MMPPHLDRLFAHLTWADRGTLRALQAAEPPPARAVALYAHILAAEHVWLARLTGRVPAHPVWPDLSVAESATLSARNEAAYGAYLRGLDAAALDRDVAYVNSAGQSFTSKAEDILLRRYLKRRATGNCCGEAECPAAKQTARKIEELARKR